MHNRLAHLLVVLLALHLAASAQPAGLNGKLQAYLDEWHKAGNFPGATLGVVLADGRTISLATGYSDRDAKTPMRPTDRMLAGSTGKTFAAATALQLVRDGKIGLDDRISKYLGSEPWFSRLPNASDVTIRMLMNHTSGIVRYEFKKEFTDFITANPLKAFTPEERLAYLFDEKPPFSAGKGWEYSDTNYIILGMIIERVTKKDFYSEARRRFIKKFKLRDTVAQEGPTIPGVIQGYAGSNNPFGGKDKMIENGKFIINPQLEWTGGGWASTSLDLARWVKIYFEGKAFDMSLMPQVLDGIPTPALGPETRYGLSAIISKTPAGTSYGHSGFFPGYVTNMMYFPEKRIAIAVQVNTSAPRTLAGRGLGRVIADVAQMIN